MMIHKNNTIKVIMWGLLFFLFVNNIVLAQETVKIIEGKVSDKFGNPLSGVMINTENKRNIGFTDNYGNFTVQVEDNIDKLTFSFLGYKSHEIILNETNIINVILEEDITEWDKRIDLGYVSTTKKELTGAASTISGTKLQKSPVANLTQSFAGRLSGLSTRETFSELSRTNTMLNVRGRSSNKATQPLVLIDGLLIDYNPNQTMEYISAAEIESVTVLKDAATQALYGIQGANGVIVITTKRGISNGLKISTYLDHSFQQVTTKPLFYNSWEYAELRNQAILNDFNAEKIANTDAMFPQDVIDKLRSGENRTLFPNNNWYDMYMKDFAMMDRVNFNVMGGNQKVQFFSNVNLMYQGGQYKTDPKQKKYNPSPYYLWCNFRSNVDVKLNNYLGAFLRLGGNVKREHTPGNNNVAGIYSTIFTVPSYVFGPTTPPVIDEETGEILDPGGVVVATDQQRSPVFGELNRRGYFNHTVTNIAAQFGVNIDLDFITEGLDINGVFAYQTNSVGSYSSTQDYARVERIDDFYSLSFRPLGTNIDTPLSIGKGSSFYYHLTYIGKLNYERTFGKHKVTGMAYGLYHNLTKADTASPWCLPYNRISSGAEVSYGYNDKYFLKADVGYSGSEQYPRDNRFTFTPAISAAWIFSEESFMKGINWLDNLKFRGSYGKTGNDMCGLNRYSYLDDVTVTPGGFLPYLQYTVNERNIGNPNISPEISTKFNLGVDLAFLNLFSFSFDVYKEKMNNMIITAAATIPSYQGIPLSYYPPTNNGIFENKGCELAVNFAKQINQNTHLSFGGFVDYNKNKVVNIHEPDLGEDYAYRKRTEGYPLGQAWGYLVDYSNGNGFFNTQEELDRYGLSVETEGNFPRLGDLIYKDLNDDKIIDTKDQAPIGKGSLIPIYYGFSGDIKYKSFGLSFLFQGVSGYSTITGGLGVWEIYYLNTFSSLHKNAWTQERYENEEKITYPALATQTNTNHKASDFFQFDRSYLRLKNLELSYTLPNSFSKAIKANSSRIIFSGQNLFTWDKMKTNDFGPEGEYNSLPVYRVYNIGINIDF